MTSQNGTEASRLNSSISAATSFAASVSTLLSSSADGALSHVAAVAVAPPSTTVAASASAACPVGTFLSSLSLDCEACSTGFVSSSTAAISCKPCAAGSAWANASACVSCPPNAVTAPYDPTACACTAGFYDTTFGAARAAPNCATCPTGGLCATGFVGAREGFWRESTLSDVFLKCREGVCMEELVTGPLSQPASINRRLLTNFNTTVPSNCVEGNTGPLCGLCVPGYALQSGQCLPCRASDAFDNWGERSKAALLVPCIIAGLVVIAFALFQPIVPALEHASATILASLSAACELSFSCCCCRRESSKESAHATSHCKAGADDDVVLSDMNPAPAVGMATPHADGAPTVAPQRKTGILQAHQAVQAAVAHGIDATLASGIGNAMAVGMELDEDEMEENAAEVILEGFDGLEDLVEQVRRVAKILINFYQIVSTFIRSLDIPWPSAFTVVMSKVNIINLNLVQSPAAACLNPSPSYYKQFNGACAAGYICVTILPHDPPCRVHAWPRVYHALLGRDAPLWQAHSRAHHAAKLACGGGRPSAGRVSVHRAGPCSAHSLPRLSWGECGGVRDLFVHCYEPSLLS